MTDESDKWQELLNRLANGEAVDWDGQNTHDAEEAQLMAQL